MLNSAAATGVPNTGHAAHGHLLFGPLAQMKQPLKVRNHSSADNQRGPLPPGGAAAEMGQDCGYKHPGRRRGRYRIPRPQGPDHQICPLLRLRAEHPVDRDHPEAADGQQVQQPAVAGKQRSRQLHQMVEHSAHPAADNAGQQGQCRPLHKELQIEVNPLLLFMDHLPHLSLPPQMQKKYGAAPLRRLREGA